MKLSPLEIRRALEAGQFVPYFQPLVCLRTSGLVGFEVLARWKHPEFGMISPETFIPLAEQDGWLGELTDAILCQAFSAASGLSHPFTLSLNISPLQLRDLTLPEQIYRIAEQTGFSLERIKIEITETALAHNLEQARIIAEGLKAMGCRIALDDFGTGYSSLLHLQSLPFDELKVDRSFVMSMTQRRESRKIVAAVIGLGQSLGLATVAEGVETREQVDMLLWLGCDLGQGWLYGKPQPAEEIPRMINLRREVPVSGARWTNLSAGNLEGLPGARLAQLQAVYDGAPVGLGFLDRDLKYVNINRRLADMHGAPIEEHLGTTVSEVIPKLYPQIEPHLRRALQGEGVADLEVSEPNPDTGVGRTFLASYQPARDEAGEVVGVSCAIVDFTARKAAEEKLRQFERVFEGLEEIVVVVDRQYRCVLANRAFHEYVGSSTEQHVGLSVPELIDNDVFVRVVKPKLVECFQGTSVHYEMKHTFPRLGERDLILSYSPIWVSGAVHAAACVVRDVTEVKLMERLNMTMQKRLELAERAGLPIGLWDWDINAHKLVWSHEAYRQWGFVLDSFSGQIEQVLSRVHPEDRSAVDEAVRRVLSREAEHFSAQYRVQHPDGSIRWVDVHGVMLGETCRHMVGFGVDITELKRIQNALRESEENYLRLLNSTAEAIYAIDRDGNCTFCNLACVRLLGYSTPQELLGKKMHFVIHHTRASGETYPIDECTIYQPIREGTGSHIVDEVLWRADGTSFPVEIWSYPMYKGNQFLGAVVSFLDISKRHCKHQD